MGISIPLKYAALTTAALLATLLCFLLMIALISTELTRQPEFIDFKISTPLISPIRPKETRQVRQKPTKTLPSEPPPQTDGVPTVASNRILTESRLPNRASLAEILGSETIQFQIAAPVRDLFPLGVVQPVYPFVAAVREIEGYVLVQFSVRPNGTVINAMIIESSPRQIFDEAALSAIRKFKFQPREIGGDAISADDIRMRFTFSMQPAYAQISN